MKPTFEASATTTSSAAVTEAKKQHDRATTGELVIQGVSTAVAASVIIKTGQGIVGSLARSPLLLFSVGVVAGYFTHKYRKEIITITSKTAEQGKDFIVRQKEHVQEMLAQSQEDEAEASD